MLNHIVLVGNLGGDPEIFYSSEKGEPIASFNLAFRLGKDKMPGWVRVTCFNKTAEVAEKYLHKGAKIGISGVLDYHKWESADKSVKSSVQVIANGIEFIKTDGRGFDEKNQEETPF
jgi:single-strand DNA-binding protein